MLHNVYKYLAVELKIYILTFLDKKCFKCDKIISFSKNELYYNYYPFEYNNDFTKFGQLLHKGWIEKKTFSNDVSNKEIDSIYEKALQLGAVGGKLTGAGGGGHLLLYCEPIKQKSVISEMKNMGLKHIPFSFHSEGSKILNLYDYNKPK